MTRLIPWLAAAFSGLLMFLSMGLSGTVSPGLLWMVALLAPVPVLWFAFKAEHGWAAFLAAVAAYVIGDCNILPAYAGTLPAVVLVLAIVAPALCFAVAAVAARFIARRLAPVSGVVAFACLWTGFDYLMAQGGNGAVTSPAYAQVGMSWMIQSASLFGLWAITFVAGFVAAALAMAASTRRWTLALAAAGILAVNLGFGFGRIALAPQDATVAVALAADDSLAPLRFQEDETSALKVVKAYADAGRMLVRDGKTSLLVFPERVAVLKPEWRGTVNAELEALAKSSRATVVIGFDERGERRRNAAFVYPANGGAPLSYAKRHLVPGLEDKFTAGSANLMIVGDGTGIAVCKDMDFPATLRSDAQFQPTLYAVPAWDFGEDGSWHARVAILRGVENGFAVVRAANNGLLSVSDAYGRVVAVRPSSDSKLATILPGHSMKTLVAEVARGPGKTLYAEIGDNLAFLALALAVLLLGVAVAAKKQPEETPGAP